MFLLNMKGTYEGYTKPKNLGFCFQPISMPNNITRKYYRDIFRTQSSFYDEVLSRK